MAKENAWYNLDNAANIYPAVSNSKNTNVYRLSCTLNEKINPKLLQLAVDTAMQSFSYFQVIMRRGLFWYYLESTDLMPEVALESGRPTQRIFYKSEKELLFHITYFGSRINLEAFHAIADGGGAINLLRTIVYHYILLAHPENFSTPPHFASASPPSDQVEDSFKWNYLPGTHRTPVNRNRSVTLSGTFLPANSVRILTARLPTRQLLTVAKKNGATVTAYLTALMLCAIYEVQMPRRHKNKEIGITIPVDLRGFFSSETARNFFGVVDIRYNFRGNPIDFPHVLSSVTQQLQEKVTQENLANIINSNMGLQQNIFARMVPLFLKNIVLKVAYRLSESSTATTISNMGRVTMPQELHPYINSFSCLLNPTPIQKVKLTVISYEDVMELTFTSVIAETGLERYFIRQLAREGIDITLLTNRGDAI